MHRRTVIRTALFGAPAVAAAAIGGAALNRAHTDSVPATTRDPNWIWDPFGEESRLPPTLGVHFHGTWDMYYANQNSGPGSMFDDHLDQLAGHGVKVLRVDVGWSASQPQRAVPSADHWYNRRISRVLDAAAARDMKVLLTLHQSPEWTRPGTGGDNRQFPANGESIRYWATWMAATYGPRVLAWEVWNEPNLKAFTGVDDLRERSVRYVPLLQAAYEGLKAGHPDAIVVFGGPCQNDDGFVRACYQLGAKDYFDVMAVHPYQGNQTLPPETRDSGGRDRMTHFPAVLDVMSDYLDDDKPVWWTEFGFSVHRNDGVPVNEPWRLGVASDALSAEYLYRSFELARREYPQVRLAIVYAAYKPSTDVNGHQYGYRMLDIDGTLRPQLPTLRGYQAAFGGSRSPLPDPVLPPTPVPTPVPVPTAPSGPPKPPVPSPTRPPQPTPSPPPGPLPPSASPSPRPSPTPSATPKPKPSPWTPPSPSTTPRR